jgi:phosphoserine/homoserine phosphotransferase
MDSCPSLHEPPVLLALDLESVLVPEIWEAVAEKTGVHELRLTTRDMPDYDELMARRVALCRSNGLDLRSIRQTIETMEPLPGAVEFLSWARSRGPVVLLSDTFYEFASPLLERLGRPLLLCHTLEVDAAGFLVRHRPRMADSKRAAVRAFRALGFRVVAVGDSFNDIAMLSEADRGILLSPPPEVALRFSEYRVVDTLRSLQSVLVLGARHA